MTDYSKLSDFEINKHVAEVVYKDRDGLFVTRNLPSREEVTVVAEVNSEDICIAAADYCNNWSDAGIVIAEHGISIAFDKNENEWVAWGHFAFDLAGWDMKEQPAEYQHDKNPLRAAMIVFLQMQENK